MFLLFDYVILDDGLACIKRDQGLFTFYENIENISYFLLRRRTVSINLRFLPFIFMDGVWLGGRVPFP